MREALFILLVLLGLVALTAFRYRRQIKAVMEFWRMARSMRELQTKAAQPLEEKTEVSEKLVNCSKCGTWIPEGRAITLGKSSVFCSAECLERSAKTA